MEELDTKQKYKLKRFINQLKHIRGRHTELVSVYIPQGSELIKTIQHLEQEQGTASNIKDAKTRKHVQDSLEKAVRHLRLYKKTPENGLACFAGNTSTNESKVNIEVFSIEPPLPLNTRMYRCDQTFMLDVLEDQLEHNESFALIVMDKREATLGVLRGNTIKSLVSLTSGVPGKYKTGGQSAARFARLREEAAKEFYKRIAEAAHKEFIGNKQLKGILVGGPGHTKNEFIDGDFLQNELKDKILSTVDITYTDEFGLQDLVEKSKDAISQQSITKEKEILTKFLELLGRQPGKVVYGEEETIKALKNGVVEILIISESVEDKLGEELEEMAAQYGSSTEIVSTETQEGQQFKSLGGIGAILRYAVK
ncbi:MAG: peptide chain release factor 1 [Nanoarchaeota archaeon]|nr:peptide chain release factor 1 [Nanoarchaeota archaeon]|tara:strand:- start:459 stop:1559 length:1101 start_codon:yes stop_codon:yes gene_type:complete